MSAIAIETPTQEVDSIAALEKIAPFQTLPAAVLKRVWENSEIRAYAPDQTIFSLGQFDGDEFFIIIDGVIKTVLTDGASGAMIVNEYGNNAMFGLELSLVENARELAHKMSATALKETKVLAVDAAAFYELAQRRPSLMRNISAYLAQNLVSLRFNARALETAPEKRVFEVLLGFVERDEVSGAWRIERMPKHREIAEAARVDEAQAAEALATLIQDGIARREYPGLIINDMARLNRLTR